MIDLPASAIDLLTSSLNAHLVTLNVDGSAQLSLVWPDVQEGEIVVGHLRFHQKLRNVVRDPRVVLSVEGAQHDAAGLRHYLVVHGEARVTQGGAPELLARIAPRFLGPGTRFPSPGAPDGWVLRISPTRIGGNGPWTG
jgi:PPOX class probable F420-dependent enzyme